MAITPADMDPSTSFAAGYGHYPMLPPQGSFVYHQFPGRGGGGPGPTRFARGRGNYQQQQHLVRQGGVHKKRKQHGKQFLDTDPTANFKRLRKENKKNAQRFYHQGPQGSAPRSVPPAPANSNRYLTHATPGLISPTIDNTKFHLVTPNPFEPGTAWKNSCASVGRELADYTASLGVNMFGSNAGLLCKDPEEAELGGDSEPEEWEGYGLQDDDADTSVQAKLQEQAAYIAELEEQNLNLSEKVFILEKQIKQLRMQQEQAIHNGEPSPDEHSERSEHSVSDVDADGSGSSSDS